MRFALLWLAAAVVSGFTLRRYLGPLDEGILMQAATRMASGEWPWRDFGWSYGPGQPLVVMGLGELFEPSLLWWRLLRVASDATCAVLVYALVRPCGARWALAAWAAAAVTAAQPTSANPTGPALAFSLAAVLFATRARPGWAGAMAALAAFWRPDVGAVAALAAAATLLLARREEAREELPAGGGAGNGHVPLPDGARRRGGGDAATSGGAGGAGGRGEGGASAARGEGVAGRGEAGGAGGRGEGGAPAASGAAGGGEPGGAGGRGEGGAPPPTRARWGRGRFVGRDERGVAARRVRVAICLLVATGGLLVLYAPFLVAAGPTTVWEALVVQATRDGEWWRLPFPAWFGGGDAKDFLTWLAPYGALIVLALAALRFRRTAGLVVLGLGAAIYYVSRADLEHAQGLLVIAAAAAAFVRPRVAGAVMLGLLLLVGVGNRASALLRPPDLAAYKGVRVPPDEAQALPRMVAAVQRLVPPGEPIYVAPLRSDLVTFSNPLVHYLTDRPNVLHRDVLLQAKPEEQARIVAALQAARPKAIVRWIAPESAKPEPNRRGRPSGSRALDDYLASAYELEGRYGDYEVLSLAASSSIAAP